MKSLKVLIFACCIVALTLTGCTSKPSKESVKKKLEASAQEQVGKDATSAQKKQVDDYIDCVVDKMYDKLSAKTLNKLVNAKTGDDFDNIKGTKSEEAAADKAAEACLKKLQ